MASMASLVPAEDTVYHPKDAITEGVKTTLIMGAAGFTVSGIQNTLARQNVTAWGVLTRTGGVIGTFAVMGAVYGFGRSASANLREKDDHWNPTIAGFIAGSAGALRTRSLPKTIGLGGGLAVLMGVFEYTGGRLSGFERDPNMDEYERKEELRRNKRRPIQETLEQLGEGRGVYGPGYRERRADRIKESYGIDVPRS